MEVATREAPIDLEGALNAVKADAVAATERTARENFMVLLRNMATSLVGNCDRRQRMSLCVGIESS